MIDSSRFRCPACGFKVFNRRLATCESCKASLPTELRFTETDLAHLEEESARIEKIRSDMAREAERLAEEMRGSYDGGG